MKFIKFIIIFILAFSVTFGIIYSLKSSKTNNIEKSQIPFTVTPTVTSKTLSYLAFGDSIAFGYGAKQSYPQILSNLIKQKTNKEVKLNNFSVLGSTSSDLLNLLNTDSNIKDNIKQANYISLNIGGNDFLKQLYNDPQLFSKNPQIALQGITQNFKSNFQKIIKQIKALSPTDCTIMTMDNYIPDNKNFYTSDFIKYVQDTNDYMASTAKDNGILISRVSYKFNGNNLKSLPNGLMQQDEIHPNDNGQLLLANSLFELIK